MSPRFDAVGIVVSNMADAVSFYRLLGLTFPEGAEGEGHVEAELPGGTRLMLDTEELVRSFDPTFEPPSSAGRVGLAFLCDGPDEVDDAYAAIRDAGHGTERSPFDAFWGQRYATVLDPDGNSVDLFAPIDS
jgi:catechol 2,3-dioxygenase-like lactoylglutathione lyase family enzyme